MLVESAIDLIILMLAFLGWKKSGTIFNPLSFYSLGLFLSLTGVIVADYYAELLNLRVSIEFGVTSVAYVYMISLICFSVPYLFLLRRIKTKSVIIVDSIQIQRHTKILSVAIALVIGGIVFVIGRFPIYEMIQGNLTIQEHIDSLTKLPIGAMALNSVLSVIFLLFFSSVLANHKTYHITFFFLLFLSAVFLLLSTWQGTRQFILLGIFLIIIRRMYGEKVRMRDLALLSFSLAGFMAAFIIIQDLRLQGVGTNTFELLMYLAWPPLNLSAIIEKTNPESIAYIPRYILWEIIPNRLFGKDLMIELGRILYEPSSPSGYLSLWYLDFGMVGVVIGSFMLSLTSLIAYVYKDKSENNLRIYLLFLWVCITSSVYSHLLHLNFFIAPVVALIVYGAVSRKGCFNKVSLK